MAGPAQVKFPGQKQRMRMRGTKQASGDVKQRLNRNLTRLLEEPDSLLPEYRGPKRIRWGRISPVHRTLEAVRRVISNRFDKKWLSKKMMGKRADAMAKAWAGSILAAQEDDKSTVSMFNHPLFGAASYVRRGDARASIIAGIQNQQNPRLRLLPWEDHAKRGWWFFSWKDGFYCSGQKPMVEDEWIIDIMERSKIKFEVEERVLATSGMSTTTVKSSEDEEGGYIRMKFDNGFVVGIDSAVLEAEKKEAIVMQFALGVLPPKLDGFVEVEFVWSPDGWSGGLPESSIDGVRNLVEAWLGLTTPENTLPSRCKFEILRGIDRGFLVGKRWFSESEDFISALSGSEIERRAAMVLLDVIDGEGLYVDLDGGAKWDDGSGALWLEDGSIHLLLTATWERYGDEILKEMFDLDGEEVEEIQKGGSRKRGAFGNFLRKIEEKTARRRVLTKFPWHGSSLDGPCGAAHRLVISARSESVSKSCTEATKLRGGVQLEAVAWGWLLVHDKAAGKDWKFDPAARELGADWIDVLTDLWKASAGMDDSQQEHYITAMQNVHRATGTQIALPAP